MSLPYNAKVFLSNITREHRTEIQIQDELDEIFRLQVQGATPKEIMKTRNLPERTYYNYNKKLQDRIIASETAKRTEEVLVQKEICKERMVDSMQIEYQLSHDEKISPRTRMDAAQRRAEIAAALFKIDIETTNWLLAYRNIQLEQPIQLTDARSPNGSRDTTGEDDSNE